MQPLVSFGPEIAADLPNALRREWLVTNGLGGYASASIGGVMTRRYHGLLVAALAPPVERTVLVGGSIDWANYDGHRYPLSTHEYGDGTIDPLGYRHLAVVCARRHSPGVDLRHRRCAARATYLDGVRSQHDVRRLSRSARQSAAGPGDRHHC